MGGISRRTLDVRLVRNCAPDELDYLALIRGRERGSSKFFTQCFPLVSPPKPAVAVTETQSFRRGVPHSDGVSLIFSPDCPRPLRVTQLVEGVERIAHANVVDGEYIGIEDGKDRRGRRKSKHPLGRK